MIEVITLEKFKQEIFDFTIHKEWLFEKQQPVILNFFASWCGPCHAFAPTLEDIAEEYAGKIKVFKIDIDAAPEAAALFGIKGVPATLFLAPQEEPAIASGGISHENMKRAITELLKC